MMRLRIAQLAFTLQQLKELPDEELVKLCQKQLPEQLDAYDEILKRHENMVFSTCYNMLNSVPDSEEITQDAFIQVFNKIHQFEGRSAFKTWLYRIVYNLCLNRRKSLAARRNRETQAGEEYVHKAETERLAFFAATPDERVSSALARLKDDSRQILSLRFSSDMSLNEIADFLEVGLSATKMRLYRAMDEFKRVYSSLPKEDH